MAPGVGNGKKLPTSYTIKGSKITQHVNTDGAAYPVIADPSIQWIPYPVVAMYGWQAETIAKVTASGFVLAPGGGCVVASFSGWVNTLFKAVCGLVGVGSVKDIFQKIGDVWRTTSGLKSTGCYGFQVWNPKAKPVTMPARDCA